MNQDSTIREPKKEDDAPNWPLTADDLYGPSRPDDHPLVYEETPIIEPIIEESVEKEIPTNTADLHEPEAPVLLKPAATVTAFRESKETNSGTQRAQRMPFIKRVVMNGLVIVVLFSLGVGTSIFLRNSVTDFHFPELTFPSFSRPVTPAPARTDEGNSGVISVDTVTPAVAVSQDQSSIPEEWKTYTIENGISGQTLAGLRYRLPPEVREPTCDSQGCASLGTDLPGGTRLTVAPRGEGYRLPDPRGKILADASGKTFTMNEIQVSGRKTTEFTGDFRGTTGGGFGFTQMRGVMIEITDNLVLEVNHYSPANKASDFAADDTVFNQILTSVTYSP